MDHRSRVRRHPLPRRQTAARDGGAPRPFDPFASLLGGPLAGRDLAALGDRLPRDGAATLDLRTGALLADSAHARIAGAAAARQALGDGPGRRLATNGRGLVALADAPLHPMAPDGPRPRALLMDPKSGVSLRLVFRDGHIDLLAHAPGRVRRGGNDATWSSDAAQPGAALQPNWTRIGDLPDPGPRLPRDAALPLLAERLRAALDQAVGAAAQRRAAALAHAAQAWIARDGHPQARSIVRRPQGAVLHLVPEGTIPLPGAAAFARALDPLRTAAAGRPVVPVARLALPKGPAPSAHAALDLLAHADALLAAAGMDPADRARYTA